MNRCLIVVCILVAPAAIVAAQPATPTPTPIDPCGEMTRGAPPAETRLKDWPQLARYHDANTKITAPGKNEDRVVFMVWLASKSEGLRCDGAAGRESNRRCSQSETITVTSWGKRRSHLPGRLLWR